MRKGVYAVTSSGRDFYSAMTRVSAASIRVSNPGVAIIAACDNQSVAAMRHSRDPLLGEIDELIVCDTPVGNNGFRNRFVKTQLRRLVDGPFLFLDSDTLVRENISEIFSLDTDIACAPNHSKDSLEQQIWSRDEEILSVMGWSTRKDAYVNGGVMFYNNSPGAVRFADDWHQKWLRSHETAKTFRDQAALNAAIFDTAPRLGVLPHRFNAQFKVTPSVASNAVLFHFYASNIDDEPITEFESLVGRLLNGAELRHSHIESMLKHNHPWRRASWVDDVAARRVLKRGYVSSEDRLWFQGHRARSLARRIAKHVRRS
jgi:Nucleotide-diphospho-sugar transferase